MSKNTPSMKFNRVGALSESRSIVTKTSFAKSNLNSNSNSDLNLVSRSAQKIQATRRKSKSVTHLSTCNTPTSLYNNLPRTPNNEMITPKSNKRYLNGYVEGKSTPECFSKVSFDTPKQLTYRNMSLESKDRAEISNLKVAVRVRPMNAKECKTPSTLHSVVITGNEITVMGGHTTDGSAGVSHSFKYDEVYGSGENVNDDQSRVFRGIALPLVDLAFEGKNTCLFAYGQTGSGKSYSMMGIDADDNIIGSRSEAGIIPRYCQEIFQRINQLKGKVHVEVEVSYFEIYNEKIHDLLAVSSTHNSMMPTNKRATLRVREHPLDGPYVVNLSTHPVNSHSALRNWLALGNSQRATAATGMNNKSSRSHSIFNIVLNMSDTDCHTSVGRTVQMKRSKISLVDLAGSERLSQTCTSGDRLREGVSINRSLLTLGKVIAALSDAKKMSNGFVPYRESVLTWLLRENLGGNSQTVMLATISPANIHLDETIATLRYACQARSIVNRIKVNEDPHDRQIRELRAEVDRLQLIHKNYERQHHQTISTPKEINESTAFESEVMALRQQLIDTEGELAQAQRGWMDRLRESENLQKAEMKVLKQNGLALEYSTAQKQPCLVNLAADPMLSGTLLYILPLGIVRIGRSKQSEFLKPDIILEGPLVAFNHCSIENDNNKLFIKQENDEFETFVNGELITYRKQIFNGDRVVIGGSHYFRISNPHCPHRLNETLVDFQTAHQEIIKQQEIRLRQKLDAEKYAALQEIEKERMQNEERFSEKLALLEMEKFRYDCSKEILESEKKAMKNQMTSQFNSFEYKLYQSNLLDEIPKLFQHSSEQFLHRTQLMVKEASKRCRDFNKNIEFIQTEIADETGIFKTVINIIDRDNNRSAEWPPARLDDWLDQIRENQITANTLFDFVTIDWKDCVEECDNNDSLNSSQLSLNLSAMKDAILGKAREQGMKTFRKLFSSPYTDNKTDLQKTDHMKGSRSIQQSSNSSKSTLNYIDKDSISSKSRKIVENVDGSKHIHQSSTAVIDYKFVQQTEAYLDDLKRATNKFKKFCHNYNNENDGINPKITNVLNSAEEIEHIAIKIRRTVKDNSVN